MAIVKNRILKGLLFLLGVLSLILAAAGVFLPILPTTPFVLLAAWCFLRSSAKTHQWIYRQRILGPILRNWEENKSISRPTKILATSMIIFSALIMWLKVTLLWIKIPVLFLLFLVILFIITRREKRLDLF